MTEIKPHPGIGLVLTFMLGILAGALLFTGLAFILGMSAGQIQDKLDSREPFQVGLKWYRGVPLERKECVRFEDVQGNTKR